MDIAFLCLTYKGLVHEKTKKWLKGKPVYLNTKEPLEKTPYTVLSIPTEWGKRSIVDATLALLHAAYAKPARMVYVIVPRCIPMPGKVGNSGYKYTFDDRC
jgi:hypothetical protein